VSVGVARLTPRESEVLRWVARGLTNKEVAAILGVSPHTVRTQLEHVFEKLDVHTRTAAVAKTQAVLGAARADFPCADIRRIVLRWV